MVSVSEQKAASKPDRDNLASYAVFAGLLATAGLPIYLHAPKFYDDTYGVSLTALAGALFLMRLFDVVQDPFFGWLSNWLSAVRGLAITIAVVVLALAMVGLFAVAPPIAPILWFALTLTLLFSAYSFLTITFYAQGVQKADQLGTNGHVRLAGWRETGALVGVCLASIAPTVLAFTGAPFAGFALCVVLLAVLAVWAMRTEWDAAPAPAEQSSSMGLILKDPIARRLLIVALVNATPMAVTSTLFLYFVDSRLQAPGFEGPLLLIFFVAAAASAGIWGKAAERFGAKPVLLGAMAFAVIVFAGASLLGPGDTLAFALICLGSGIALGADLTLLPAIFAARLSRVAPQAAEGFGLWSFVSKFTLAFAAITLLPLLEYAGLDGPETSTQASLELLTVLYALVPCALKVIAIALLAATPLQEES
ncbi:MAG: MFS transporter [Pseudomonadota bacterium]